MAKIISGRSISMPIPRISEGYVISAILPGQNNMYRPVSTWKTAIHLAALLYPLNSSWEVTILRFVGGSIVEMHTRNLTGTYSEVRMD